MDWDAIFTSFINGCINIAWRLLVALIILVVGRFVIKFVIKLMKNNKKFNDKLDPTVLKFVCNVVKFGLYALLGIAIVGTLGIETASVIAVLASAGAAIALAVKGAFSNLVGGIMLLIFRPVSVNDFVEVGGKSGTVEDVGIFYTTLRTGDNLTVNVPNAMIVDSVTINYSRKDNRRLDLTIDVAYGTDIEKAKQVISDVIAADEKALKDPAPFVRMTAMKDSSIEITVRVWCAKGDFGALKSDLLEALDKALAAENIEIPFPQLEVRAKK